MPLLEELKVAAALYSQTESGKWLNDFCWADVPVTFKGELPGDIAGLYSFGGIVLLRADVSTIFPIYVHELRHRWQWKRNPLKYIVGKLYRPLIENDADTEQNKADNWFCEMADKERS